MMSEFQATFVMIALFALRCILPIVLTLALGYLMNRLVDRWEAEEAAAAQEKDALPAPSGPQPGPALPAQTTSRPALALPCWLIKGCDPSRRDNCPAYRQRGKPCWAARLQLSGTLPAECPDCPIYQRAHA